MVHGDHVRTNYLAILQSQLCPNGDNLTVTCHNKLAVISLTYIWIIDCCIGLHRRRRVPMTVQRDVRLLAAERQEVEQKIKAVEEWNNLLLENAKRTEMYSYGRSNTVLKEMPNSGSQLSLWPENER